MCSKTYCFRFVLQNEGKYGRFHPFIYSCARKKLWTATGLVKMKKKENKELSLGERRKKGKGEKVRMGVA